jgi:catechol 2,3-dioxygenase-like lactoylglutathione lyase family enzyme
MRVTAIDHVNIRTHDLDRLVAFCTEVLGLDVGERPPFRSRGAWLYAAGHPVLHVSVTDREPGGDTLPLDHVAFAMTGLAAMRRRLEAAGVEHEVFGVPGRAMQQIFLHDPDGVALELTFADPADVGTTPSATGGREAGDRRRSGTT